MNRTATIILPAVFTIALLAPRSHADVDIGLSVDSEGIKGFYLAIGEHYEMKEREVVAVRKRNVPDEELPVVFFLARNAKVAPAVIVKLRLGGMSWMEITRHFGFGAEVFYVKLESAPGPPYGKAWGHFKKKRTEWKNIDLVDADIVNFVNLKFVADRYGHSPSEIAKRRAKGDSFVAIHKHVKAHQKHHRKKARVVASSEAQKQKVKGKKKK